MNNAERMRAVIAARRKPVTSPVPAALPTPVQEVTPPPAAATTEPAQAPAVKRPKEKYRHAEQRPASYHDSIHAVRGRLPDGATFRVTYDDQLKRWSGSLEAAGTRFEGHAGGVFTLLHQLDSEFRRWKLAQQAGGADEPAVGTG